MLKPPPTPSALTQAQCHKSFDALLNRIDPPTCIVANFIGNWFEFSNQSGDCDTCVLATCHQVHTCACLCRCKRLAFACELLATVCVRILNWKSGRAATISLLWNNCRDLHSWGCAKHTRRCCVHNNNINARAKCNSVVVQIEGWLAGKNTFLSKLQSLGFKYFAEFHLVNHFCWSNCASTGGCNNF